MMGPFKVFGSILHEHAWAYSCLSTVSFIVNNWSIHAHRQFSSSAGIGPFEAIGSCFIGKLGPMGAHRQLSSWAVMGPFKTIGSILHRQKGPIHSHRQFHSCAGMGPFVVTDSFSQ